MHAHPSSPRRRWLAMACAVFGLASPTAWSSAASAADLKVQLTGVRNASGDLRAALFDRADAFRKEDKALALVKLPAAPGVATVVFPSLAPGRYAVMAYHDENADGAMDRMFGMIPTEGYGLSNNPEVFGPPAFEQSAFDLPAAGAEIVVNLRY
ncbi:MAG TPA: DUF2141 domain-containing protein [Azospirillaceae bacterium]|nr:DUF2141 domain-containing protein [Azospirillaceae bacterium]HRQ81076.1 DUF2141 domain-containing protein [Azospirillaceae bacterium]